MPIQANAESVCVTPTPEVSRRNGPTNATTYATTTSRVLERSASPPCQLRASPRRARKGTRGRPALGKYPYSQFAKRTNFPKAVAVAQTASCSLQNEVFTTHAAGLTGVVLG